MFLFRCCQEFQTGLGYQLQKHHRNKQFVNNLKQIDPRQLHEDGNRVIKLRKSDYDQIYSAYSKSNKKFIDNEFPANSNSLGQIEGITDCEWKRISDMIDSPRLLGERIEPKHVTKGSLRDCYFLSALATLSENQDNILNLFGTQTYNSAGLYRVLIKKEAEIQEVIIDDYIPVDSQGQPLFCHPNNNQFWVLILEKAWAKVNGSYASIIMGNPTDVLTAFTFAPAAVVLVKETAFEREKQWNMLREYVKQHFPICCNTREDTDSTCNLSPAHSYTLLDTLILEDMQGKNHKLLKLRDPWGKGLWNGSASINDIPFWKNIANSSIKNNFCKQLLQQHTDVFSITFDDFCKHFSQISYCLHQPNSNYTSQQLICNKKNGSLFQVQVHKKALYSFTLHQSQLNQTAASHTLQQNFCRATLLLIRNTNGLFDLVNAVLKYNDQDAVLTELLESGHYLLFAKIDPTPSGNLIPLKTIVSVYSTRFTVLQPISQTKYANLFKEMLLRHAHSNKRNKYNDGLMWISWKLLFQQGGYAYIAMGVQPDSKKKFVIDFDQHELQKMNFKLKGEFKHKGTQRIEISPGQQKIIVARVKNQIVTTLKFPPPIPIKIQPID